MPRMSFAARIRRLDQEHRDESDVTVVGERDRRDEANQNSAPPPGGAALPEPGFLAVRGLRDTQRPLRRRQDVQDADPLGGTPVPEPVVAELRRQAGRGTAMHRDLAAPLEEHFGMDLSAVRVHDDAGAGQLARSLQATAFTHGNDIYLAPGALQPGSAAGQHVLAHEISHIAAQRTGADGVRHGALTVGDAADPAEAAADRSADRAMAALRRSCTSEAPTLRSGGRADTRELRRSLSHGGNGERPTATTRPLASTLRRSVAAADAGVIRRKISKTSADINALRSKKGVSKGERTEDTLHKIGVLLDAHPALSDHEKIVASLGAIAALCEYYLDRHRSAKEKDRRMLVEEIMAEALRDHGTALAQARYLNDLRAGIARPNARNPLPAKATNTPLSQHLNPSVVSNAHFDASLRNQKLHELNPKKAAADLITKAGLTEAEIAAIKTFTANDYLYINPAIEQNSDWLDNQMGQIQGAMDGIAQMGGKARTADAAKLSQEGATHAGVIMQAAAKMPALTGRVHRGARMSAQEFKDTYGSKTQISYKTFVSSGVLPGPARNYANGGGSKPPRADQSISVFCVFDVDDARDISTLSEVQSEKEWLLLPGATFQITKIEDDPDGQEGKAPKATACKLVHLKQIPRPKQPPAPRVAPGAGAAAGAAAPAQQGWRRGARWVSAQPS